MALCDVKVVACSDKHKRLLPDSEKSPSLLSFLICYILVWISFIAISHLHSINAESYHSNNSSWWRPKQSLKESYLHTVQDAH